VGTEALLHRADGARAVIFLDFDQEMLAGRLRAGEESLALLARAARLLGDRDAGGRLVVQTRVPAHPVLLAALHADPGRLADTEAAVRRALEMAPPTALALVSGDAAAAYVGELPTGAVEVLGPTPGTRGPVFLLRSSSHRGLCDALATTARPSGGLRIDVDPRRA
jgi:primosomal protein N' (replication factor Y)